MLPAGMETSFRQVWEQVRWTLQDYGFEREPQRVVIAGLPGAGKKTLFNTLWGREVIGSGVPLPLTGADFGLFRLMDLPCDLNESESFLYPLPLEDATVIVYVLNGVRGLTPEDFQWLSRLRVGRAALLILLNPVEGQALVDKTGIEAQLALQVLSVAANDANAVRSLFVEALLRAAPELLTPLAAQLNAVRHVAAQRIIRQATVLGLAVSVEPLPLLDLPLLIGIQLRLLSQLGTLYGKRVSLQNDWQTVLAVAFGVLLRYGAQTLMKFIPWGGWIVSGLLGASATWAVGQTALLLHEDGSPVRLWWRRWEGRIHARTKRFHR